VFVGEEISGLGCDHGAKCWAPSIAVDCDGWIFSVKLNRKWWYAAAWLEGEKDFFDRQGGAQTCGDPASHESRDGSEGSGWC